MLEAPFEAELAGHMYGITFQARLVLSKKGEGACAPATLTFYAPHELVGTTLSRDATGRVTMSYDDVTVSDGGGGGAALLSLFPTASQAERVMVNEAGNTVVLFDRTEIEFSAQGVPLFIKNDDVEAQIISFKSLD